MGNKKKSNKEAQNALAAEAEAKRKAFATSGCFLFCHYEYICLVAEVGPANDDPGGRTSCPLLGRGLGRGSSLS